MFRIPLLSAVFLVGCATQTDEGDPIVNGSIDCDTLVATQDTRGKLVEIPNSIELELRRALPARERKDPFCWFELPKGYYFAKNNDTQYAFAKFGKQWTLFQNLTFTGPQDDDSNQQ